jgi:hypothetical protein
VVCIETQSGFITYQTNDVRGYKTVHMFHTLKEGEQSVSAETAEFGDATKNRALLG